MKRGVKITFFKSVVLDLTGRNASFAGNGVIGELDDPYLTRYYGGYSEYEQSYLRLKTHQIIVDSI